MRLSARKEMRTSRGVAQPEPEVAVLIGSDLRAFDNFLARLDALLVDPQPYDVFISTDRRSLDCAMRHNQLRRSYMRWFGESPDTAAAMRLALSPLAPGVSPHHLHQWWRLQHAWEAMVHHEKTRALPYKWVVRLRSDLRLPSPIELAPKTARQLHGDDANRTLVMRGDWVFWGHREAVRTALTYREMLPQFQRLGQHAYMPLPFRHMLAVGPEALNAGLWGWFKFPRRTKEVPFGFDSIATPHGVLRHAAAHLSELEAFHSSGAAGQVPKNGAFSQRDGWWRWNGIPDNEKYFFYHVLNQSLIPINMLALFNSGKAQAEQVSFLGRSNGLLMPESIRHHPNCSCVCKHLL